MWTEGSCRWRSVYVPWPPKAAPRKRLHVCMSLSTVVVTKALGYGGERAQRRTAGQPWSTVVTLGGGTRWIRPGCGSAKQSIMRCCILAQVAEALNRCCIGRSRRLRMGAMVSEEDRTRYAGAARSAEPVVYGGPVRGRGRVSNIIRTFAALLKQLQGGSCDRSVRRTV